MLWGAQGTGTDRSWVISFACRVCILDLVDINGKIGIERSVAGLKKGTNMDHFALKIEPFNEAEIRQHLQGYGIKAGEGV